MFPPNFSWVIKGLLAGSEFPTTKAHFQFFQNEGIRNIVNLTPDKVCAEFLLPGMCVIDITIEEFLPPSLEQVIRFVDVVEEARAKNESVVCHCHWGRGRTGTMMAAYLVKHHSIPARVAIDRLREMRPYSVETKRQEKAVFNYAEYLEEQTNGRSRSGNVDVTEAVKVSNGEVCDDDENDMLFYHDE